MQCVVALVSFGGQAQLFLGNPQLGLRGVAPVASCFLASPWAAVITRATWVV